MLLLKAALFLTAALTAAANPILSDRDEVSPCALVLCKTNTTCQVINGSPKCLPLTGGPKCGSKTCGKGLTCCNSSCGICTPPGGFCTQQFCGVPEKSEEEKPQAGTPCGPNVCAAGLECCNSSCGFCTKPGQGCTKQFCLPQGDTCGPDNKKCPGGMVCCNSSCGICTPPGGVCTQQFCG